MLKVATAPDDRRLDRRAGIGMAVKIVQAEALPVPHLSIDMAGILRVTRGRKRVRGRGLDVVFDEGDIALFGGGGVYDVLNMPDDGGLYCAEAVFFESDALPAWPERGTKAAHGVVRIGGGAGGLPGGLAQARAALGDPALPDPVAAHRVRELLIWLQAHGLSLVAPRSENTVVRLRQLLSSDLSAAWPAASVAEQLAMSEATLRRRLAEKNETLSGVLADLRMCAALTLLQATEDSIAAIALAVGYDSPSRFAERFRDRFGFAPSRIRQQRD